MAKVWLQKKFSVSFLVMKMYNVRLLPRAVRQLRKVKERPLLTAYQQSIEEIAGQPFQKSKSGDLKGIWSHGFIYKKTAYRIAYMIKREEATIYVIALGSHEGFWQEIKRYLES